jgi:sugar O-acyltransferase (sialic acid O-acetyltransferase NeuD family)
MNKPNIILIGGGGHCKSCIDVIEQENKFTIAGIIDIKEKIGESILGYTIIGSDDDLPEIAKKYDYFLITLGQIKSSTLRTKLYHQVKSLNKKLPTIISPNAYVSKHSIIGKGTIIMHHALVNSNSSIGENCIINTKALIEHDVSIGNHNHISTATAINGDVKIGNSNTIGSHTTIIQNTTLSNNILIGAGSLVLKNITTKGTYAGIPTKQI